MHQFRNIIMILRNYLLLSMIVIYCIYEESWSHERIIEFPNSDTTQTFHELRLDGVPRYKPGRLLHLALVVQDYEGEGEKIFRLRIDVRDNSDEWNVCLEKKCISISKIFGDLKGFSLSSTNIGLRVGYIKSSSTFLPVVKITIGFKTNGSKHIEGCGRSLFSIESNMLLFTITSDGRVVEKAIICGGRVIKHNSY